MGTIIKHDHTAQQFFTIFSIVKVTFLDGFMDSKYFLIPLTHSFSCFFLFGFAHLRAIFISLSTSNKFFRSEVCHIIYHNLKVLQ